jgi:FixJ family two-component response regulator
VKAAPAPASCVADGFPKGQYPAGEFRLTDWSIPDVGIRHSGKGKPLDGRSTTVAIIDDNPSMLRSIRRLLNVAGFSVETFPSAEAFLEEGGCDRAACVVLDIHLPGMSGFELRRHLTAGGSGLPVIFVTAINDEELQDAATLLGCVAYLNKPFAPEALVAAVGEALTTAKPT